MKEEMEVNLIDDEKEYDIEKIGSYGKFSTKTSYPIEYILTSLRPDQLSEYLTFAKDVRPKEIDFDLLMQRDLDEDRVRNEIAPYLDPDTYTDPKNPDSSLPRALFFPPLLVAVAPVEGKSMGGYYDNEVCSFSDNKKLAYRKWGDNLFKITYQVSNSATAPLINSYDANGDSVNIKVKPGQVLFEGWRSKKSSPGIRLIVIDGQHRLKALQDIYERKPEAIDDLQVPVCLLFAPNSQDRLKDKGVLSVPEVFRQLFVDVNNTAETVGGHFNILLSDNNIGSLVCRQFCSNLLKKEDGKKRLSVVEWNTKKAKDSSNVVRKYSLTSIGVIEKALRECFKKSPSELEYWLNLKAVESNLYPDDEEKGSIECPVVDWDTFNSVQRKCLAEQVNKYAVPLFENIFFGSKPYKKAFEIFDQELIKLEQKLEDDKKGLTVYTPAYEQIVDYMQIPDDKQRDNKEALAVVKAIGNAVEEKLEDSGLRILQYALYQRALVAFWFELLQVGNIFNVDPEIITKILISILDEQHSDEMKGVLSYKRGYMQYSVFQGSTIITLEETRKALKNLFLSFLGREQTLAHIQDIVKDTGINDHDFLAKLKEKGDLAPSEFIKSFEKGFIKDFKRTYTLNQSLSPAEKDKIQQAEAKQKQHKKEYRDKTRAKEDISHEFDDLVGSYSIKTRERASAELKEALNLSLDIISEDSYEEYGDEEA